MSTSSNYSEIGCVTDCTLKIPPNMKNQTIPKSFTQPSMKFKPKRFNLKSHSMSEINYSHLKVKKNTRSSNLSELLKTDKMKKGKNNVYGHRYFCGKYGSKYATHRKLKNHHNKMHKPFRLFDVRTIRYGASYLLQRLLDVFMICWFICGNYWIFNAVEADQKKRLKSGSINSTKPTLAAFNQRKNKTLEFKTNFTHFKYFNGKN